MNVSEFIQGLEAQLPQIDALIEHQRTVAEGYRDQAGATADLTLRAALTGEAHRLELDAASWEETRDRLIDLIKQLKERSTPS